MIILDEMLLSVVMQKKTGDKTQSLIASNYEFSIVSYRSSTLRFTNLANASPLSMLLASSAKSIS